MAVDMRGFLLDRVEIDDRGCWLWQLSTNNGYGRFRIPGGSGEQAYAHRTSYESFVGPIPAGYQIDHLCRVPRCINPAHLEAVTQAENIRRGVAPTIVNWRAGVCKHGHSTDDAYVRTDGSRRCRTCHREQQRVAEKRRRAARRAPAATPGSES